MKLMLKPYFILSVVLYLLIRILRLFEIQIPEIINSHLTDFLFIPILLTLSLVGVRILKRDECVLLTKGMVISSLIIVSLVFELIMPFRSVLYVKDYWDIAAYGLGTAAFWFLQRKEALSGRNLSQSSLLKK